MIALSEEKCEKKRPQPEHIGPKNAGFGHSAEMMADRLEGVADKQEKKEAVPIQALP